MRARWRIAVIGIGLISGLCGAAPEKKGYAPVAPVAAVHAAVQANVKIVQDWIDEKDFASAMQAAQGLKVLGRLYVYQGSDTDWRKRAAPLAETASRLVTATRAKDPGECAKLIQESNKLLGELAKSPPTSRSLEKNFKPEGNTRIWMLLLEGTYSDTRAARNPVQLEQLAQAVAEEANAVQYLRDDDRWAQSFQQVRAAALDAAAKAAAKDMTAASAALKIVRQRCDICHQTSRKK